MSASRAVDCRDTATTRCSGSLYPFPQVSSRTGARASLESLMQSYHQVSRRDVGYPDVLFRRSWQAAEGSLAALS